MLAGGGAAELPESQQTGLWAAGCTGIRQGSAQGGSGFPRSCIPSVLGGIQYNHPTAAVQLGVQLLGWG